MRGILRRWDQVGTSPNPGEMPSRRTIDEWRLNSLCNHYLHSGEWDKDTIRVTKQERGCCAFLTWGVFLVGAFVEEYRIRNYGMVVSHWPESHNLHEAITYHHCTVPDYLPPIQICVFSSHY